MSLGKGLFFIVIITGNIICSMVMKGLGKARRIDEAFQLLESVERGSAIGRPRLSPPLIYGFLNALVEAGQFYKLRLKNKKEIERKKNRFLVLLCMADQYFIYILMLKP